MVAMRRMRACVLVIASTGITTCACVIVFISFFSLLQRIQGKSLLLKTSRGGQTEGSAVIWRLQQPLLRFPGVPQPWTLQDAFQHTQIFGSPGSGKTSGSGYHIASAFLSAGFGGLVLAAKTSEVGLWQSLAKQHGRDQDLIVIDSSGSVPFNFMDFELKRGSVGGGDPAGIVDLFMELARLRDDRPNAGGGENDQFFRDNTGRLIRAAITVATLATGEASLPFIEELINSGPRSPEDLRDASWSERSILAQAILHVREQRWDDLTEDQQLAFDRAESFWLDAWAALPERTRESIRATYQGISDQFLEGRYRRLFCSGTGVVPEVTHHGAIIVLDLPPSEHGAFGRIAQVLFKHLWQQATLRRIPKSGDTDNRMRPVFLWTDESQNFITSLDSRFLNEAREARAAVVFLTQGKPNYEATLGHERTMSMLTSLGTKVFHALGDSNTIEYAIKLAGELTVFRKSIQPQIEGQRPSMRYEPQVGYQESEESVIDTEDFYRLAKGDNVQGVVEALVIMTGRTWPPSDQPCYLWPMYRRGV